MQTPVIYWYIHLTHSACCVFVHDRKCTSLYKYSRLGDRRQISVSYVLGGVPSKCPERCRRRHWHNCHVVTSGLTTQTGLADCITSSHPPILHQWLQKQSAPSEMHVHQGSYLDASLIHSLTCHPQAVDSNPATNAVNVACGWYLSLNATRYTFVPRDSSRKTTELALATLPVERMFLHVWASSPVSCRCNSDRCRWRWRRLWRRRFRRWQWCHRSRSGVSLAGVSSCVVDGIEQVLGVECKNVCCLQHATAVLIWDEGCAVLLGKFHRVDQLCHVRTQHFVCHLNLPPKHHHFIRCFLSYHCTCVVIILNFVYTLVYRFNSLHIPHSHKTISVMYTQMQYKLVM